MATFDEFYRSLPEDNGRRGEFFEKVFVPWFLKTDPEWSNKIRVIWLWNEYPHRWGKDCGIDLVYEDSNGNHWAVQSKCVAPDREISKAEIDSFLSESNDPRFHGRLLITSTDGIGKNAQQVIERQEKQVICFLREHFAQSAVEFPSSPDDISTGRRKNPLTPRPHQEEAIRNVVAGLQIHERGQLLMACGTGKTLTALWIKEELRSHRTLVLLPSLSLLSQTLREWTANSRKPFNWICVCSDQSVAKQDRTTDEWIEHTSELGAPVISDLEEIRRFLHGEAGGVVFCTYQSSPLVAEAQTDQITPAFDLAFADEAHRCAGKVSAAFGCILDDAQIRSSKRLFMTATPRILSHQIKSKAVEAEIEVASMDDESVFGTVLHRLNFSEAIDGELLTDYRVVVIGIDDNEIKEKIDHRVLATIDGHDTTDYETLAQHIALSMVVKEYELQRIISFHGKIEGAKKFAEDHPKIIEWLPENRKTNKKVYAEYVSGGMTALERNRKIDGLRQLSSEEVGILSNARCLSEGVDVPALDGIVFIDPRNSQVDIIQAVGRAIRKSSSKRQGYILLPIYLGDGQDLEEEVLASRFNLVYEVINALKSQDNSLANTLDSLRVEIGRKSSHQAREVRLEKIVFDLPEKVSVSLANALRTEVVMRTTSLWDEYFGKLLDFIEENGHSRVEEKHDKQLNKWVVRQRTSYRQERLSRMQTERLEGITEWEWDIIEAEWSSRFKELLHYLNAHGFSLAGIQKKNPELSAWVNTQRSFFKKGILDSARIIALEEVKGWNWSQQDENWESRYNSYIDFLQSEARRNNKRESGKWRNWVSTQRNAYKKCKMQSNRIKRLEEIEGWRWEVIDDNWMSHFEALKKYALQNTSAAPPSNFPRIGRWVNSQRTAYKRNQLSQERIDRLESLEGWVWITRKPPQPNQSTS